MIWRYATRVARAINQPASRTAARHTSSRGVVDDVVRENDVVLLSSGAPKHFLHLSKPLKHGSKIQTHYGVFHTSNIIGKPYRSLVTSGKDRSGLRILLPTLAEYTALTPRVVTPIYPQDAHLIVSLLDIHVAAPPSLSDEPYTGPKLEILEAGTGHGSLTLHLARAIQAANPPIPDTLLSHIRAAESDTPSEQDDLLARWKATRRAVVHTIEKFAANAAVARRTIAGFRHGIYSPHIDSHVGDVSAFIDSAIASRSTPGQKTEQIFSHIILDLPGAHNYVRQAARALKDGGTLILFCPSVTQIAQAVQKIRALNLPLAYSSVLELGLGMSGGKQWDVRAVKLQPAPPSIPVAKSSFVERLKTRLAQFLRVAPPEPLSSERWETVARPSVGHRVAGGGFVGVWHRKRTSDPTEDAAVSTGQSSHDLIEKTTPASDENDRSLEKKTSGRVSSREV